jgi:hypothetical protein
MTRLAREDLKLATMRVLQRAMCAGSQSEMSVQVVDPEECGDYDGDAAAATAHGSHVVPHPNRVVAVLDLGKQRKEVDCYLPAASANTRRPVARPSRFLCVANDRYDQLRVQIR